MKKEIQKIADRMGDAYGFPLVNANAILGKSREKNIVHIRKILLAVLEDTTKYSRTEIAARFNRTYQQIFNLIKDGRKKNELAINAIKGDLDLKDFVDEQSKHISTN
jgi:chromosomal replication initiation ATPase DnaA